MKMNAEQFRRKLRPGERWKYGGENVRQQTASLE